MAGTGVRRGRLKAWWGLSLGEKVELLAVVSLACVAEVAVKLISLPRLASRLGITLVNHGGHAEERRGDPARMGWEAITKRARMVDRVYRHWPRRRSCLRRALVLGYRIRKAAPTLLIGVAREDGEIRAHAWIEVEGNVVGEESGDWAPLRSHETAG